MKKGEVLIENIVFILLNMAFLTILVLFLLQQGNGARLLENSYSKELALLIDSARPGTIVHLNLKDLKETADKNGIAFSDVVSVDNDKNYVTIKLSEKGGYRYHFFNDVDVDAHLDSDPEYEGYYVLTFSNPKSS